MAMSPACILVLASIKLQIWKGGCAIERSEVRSNCWLPFMNHSNSRISTYTSPGSRRGLHLLLILAICRYLQALAVGDWPSQLAYFPASLYDGVLVLSPISTFRDVLRLQRRSYMVSSSCKRRFKGPKLLECGIGGRRGARLHFLVYKEYIDFMTPKSIVMHSRLRLTGRSITSQRRGLDD